MNRNRKKFTLMTIALLLGTAHWASAQWVSQSASMQLTRFEAGTPASAAAVNANFDTLVARIDELAGRNAALERRLTDLEDLLAAFELSPDGSEVRLVGKNLRLLNGEEGVRNGRGCIFLGYAEVAGNPIHCLASGPGHRLEGEGIVAVGHELTVTASWVLIAGRANTVAANFAAAIGGWLNQVRGAGSVAAGGSSNVIDGRNSTIAAGDRGRVLEDADSVGVIGGADGVAADDNCTVVGGSQLRCAEGFGVAIGR